MTKSSIATDLPTGLALQEHQSEHLLHETAQDQPIVSVDTCVSAVARHAVYLF